MAFSPIGETGKVRTLWDPSLSFINNSLSNHWIHCEPFVCPWRIQYLSFFWHESRDSTTTFRASGKVWLVEILILRSLSSSVSEESASAHPFGCSNLRYHFMLFKLMNGFIRNGHVIVDNIKTDFSTPGVSANLIIGMIYSTNKGGIIFYSHSETTLFTVQFRKTVQFICSVTSEKFLLVKDLNMKHNQTRFTRLVEVEWNEARKVKAIFQTIQSFSGAFRLTRIFNFHQQFGQSDWGRDSLAA